MLWFIAALIIAAIVILFAILKNLQIIEQLLSENSRNQATLYGKLEEIHGDVQKKGSVTPPIDAANKTHTPGASTRHIIIRKSPDQIRAENADAIRSGAAEYGKPTA